MTYFPDIMNCINLGFSALPGGLKGLGITEQMKGKFDTLEFCIVVSMRPEHTCHHRTLKVLNWRWLSISLQEHIGKLIQLPCRVLCWKYMSRASVT